MLGARRSLLALAESFDPERWRPVVCGQSYGALGEALEARGIPMEVVWLGWWRKGKYMLWRPFAISRLAALARQVGADLIHCNELYPHPYAVRAAQNVPAPEGSPCQGGSVPVVTHIRLDMKPGMIRKYDLGRADRIVVPSEALAHEFDEWPDREQRVSVIPNGVNMEEFQRSRTAQEARRELGLDPERRLLAAVGQLSPRKGGDVILSAFEQIAGEFPDVDLLFVGDPHRGQEEFAEALRARAVEAPFKGRVHFFPFSNEVLPYYEAADINLLISRAEGFGRTLIESAAVGIPSIGAATGGIQEIILDGVTGYLVPPEAPERLAERLTGLLSDEHLLSEMANAAFRRAAQEYSIRAHAEKVMDLYDEVLEQKGQLT